MKGRIQSVFFRVTFNDFAGASAEPLSIKHVVKETRKNSATNAVHRAPDVFSRVMAWLRTMILSLKILFMTL
jgi:hypothetical protein